MILIASNGRVDVPDLRWGYENYSMGKAKDVETWLRRDKRLRTTLTLGSGALGALAKAATPKESRARDPRTML